MATREPVYVALWNLLLNDSRIKGAFVTTSSARFLSAIDTFAPDQLPALFLVQHGESWERAGRGIPGKRTLQCSLVAYASSPAQSERYPATQLNALMDAIDDLLENPGNPSNAQILGGLVEHVYIEGEVRIEEGMLSDDQRGSVLICPLTILLP
jgi:hypothetical protein